ncbi:PREDICTED: peptide-N(4)-(N-acetyl-beta-glucosaminyl)asparagine amidase isoform X2 [Nelumbo nucifera]|uniref:Peptide-N(4)-(N-acetyl-beta- glucosaminyl)asparagine amidase isoform X2 n=1 Tax=Nelumbo nucifera TaxID=4432 RepID=A0A1U8Q4K2_NELNU|nr:PREDICTED: peptide-N(4)-(N-acetyl-beta-glucosaminyl)asparagine amidase isoform X2 [Nelumbo nucifera]
MVFKFQIFSLTSIPPDEQKIYGGENLLIIGDSDLNSVTDKLRVVSITEREESSSAPAVTEGNSLTKSDEELARMLQAEEEALFYQQFRAGNSGKEFEERIRPHLTQVLMYEDPIRQEAARKSVPIDELEEKALLSLAKEGNFKPSKIEQDHAFLLQLLFWFKQSFRWVNSPSCDGCGSETTTRGMGDPLPLELRFGASRVEIYGCTNCSRVTRFPRYNDPLKLVETRRGRCGEWANCFTLYCRAFGYEARLILDFTDHVWTECFSHLLGRWMHLDPCDGVYDNPLLYEKGWKKNLSYAIAIAKDGVHDITKRYTRKWHEVLSRRNIATEPVVSAVLSDITKECRKGLSSQELVILEDRDRKEANALERGLHSQDDTSISLPGRQSGAKEWRIARSEIGSDSLSSSLCPVRICFDGHVSSIYTAFYSLLLQLVDNGLPTSEIVEILKMVKRVLLNLKNTSFRSRRASIDLDSNVSQIMPSMDGLLTALSLKSELEKDGKLTISLAGDPVKTSIALPVALDTIDDIVDDLKSNHNIDKNSLPIWKLNRISSGSVLASGEELPLEIVTSAFDGIRMSKWGEPNGAKGSWIIYKIMDGKMHNLEAYELMSANDAPERDPMDWVVEGSDDGGSSWYVLDKQMSQIFTKRFQRKTFKIGSTHRLSNAFRFRFLAVRNAQQTTRLQIGSIDLFARTS